MNLTSVSQPISTNFGEHQFVLRTLAVGPDGTAADSSSITTATATIANSASLSDAINLAGKGLVRINMPASWTAANLTFQFSMDGVTYRDAYTATGTEYVVTAAASRSIILVPADFVGVRYIKVRSGTASVPVNQGGSRALELVTRPL